MLAIGLILILLALGGGGYVGWLAQRASVGVALTGGGVSLSVLPITLFACGAASMVLLWLGVRLVGVGFRHKRSRRRELKELRDSGGGTTTIQRPAGRDNVVGDRTGRESTGRERKVDPGS